MKVLYFHQHFTTPKAGGAIRSYEFAKRLIQKYGAQNETYIED